MIRVVLKHVYGRWQAIVDDKELGIQELICKELNFPHIILSAAEQAGLQGQNGSGSSNPGAQNNQNHNGSGITGNNNAFADAGQVNSMFYYRDMQRRLVEFVKKRVLLLEKALNYEYAEEFYGLGGSSSMPSEEPEAEVKVTDTVGVDFIEVNDEMLDGLPKTDPINAYTGAFKRLSTIWDERGDAYTNANARVSLENIAVKRGYKDVSDLTPGEIAIKSFLGKEESMEIPDSDL